MTDILTLEVVLAAIDRASDVFKGVKTEGESMAQTLTARWAELTIAGAAFGASIEASAQLQQGLSQTTFELSTNMGVSEQTIRDTTLAVAGYNDTAGEMLALMHKAQQQGAENIDQMKDFAVFYDRVADATGNNAESLASLGNNLKKVGIDTDNLSDANNALAYVYQFAGGNLQEFMTFVGRAGTNMNKLGLDINDAAAAMGILKDRGDPARVAISEINAAMKTSIETGKPLNEVLGISAEKWTEYKQKVAACAGDIDKLAEKHDELLTPLQRVTNELGNLNYKYGDMAKNLDILVIPLIAMGPTLKGVSEIQALWNKEMVAATVATVTHTGAAEYDAAAIWAQAEATVFGTTVTEGLVVVEGEAVIATTTLGETIMTMLPYLALIAIAIGALYVAWSNNWGGIRDKTTEAADWIGDRFKIIQEGAGKTGEAIGKAFDKVTDENSKMASSGSGLDVHKEKVDGVAEAYKMFGSVLDLLNAASFAELINIINKTSDGFAKEIDNIWSVIDAFGPLGQSIRDLLEPLDNLSQNWETFGRATDNLTQYLRAYIDAGGDATLMGNNWNSAHSRTTQSVSGTSVAVQDLTGKTIDWSNATIEAIPKAAAIRAGIADIGDESEGTGTKIKTLAELITDNMAAAAESVKTSAASIISQFNLINQTLGDNGIAKTLKDINSSAVLAQVSELETLLGSYKSARTANPGSWSATAQVEMDQVQAQLDAAKKQYTSMSGSQFVSPGSGLSTVTNPYENMSPSELQRIATDTGKPPTPSQQTLLNQALNAQGSQSLGLAGGGNYMGAQAWAIQASGAGIENTIANNEMPANTIGWTLTDGRIMVSGDSGNTYYIHDSMASLMNNWQGGTKVVKPPAATVAVEDQDSIIKEVMASTGLSKGQVTSQVNDVVFQTGASFTDAAKQVVQGISAKKVTDLEASDVKALSRVTGEVGASEQYINQQKADLATKQAQANEDMQTQIDDKERDFADWEYRQRRDATKDQIESVEQAIADKRFDLDKQEADSWRDLQTRQARENAALTDRIRDEATKLAERLAKEDQVQLQRILTENDALNTRINTLNTAANQVATIQVQAAEKAAKIADTTKAETSTTGASAGINGGTSVEGRNIRWQKQADGSYVEITPSGKRIPYATYQELLTYGGYEAFGGPNGKDAVSAAGLGGAGHYARGGISPGGVAVVGEEGPELVNLPGGSKVTSNNDIATLLGQIRDSLSNLTVISVAPMDLRDLERKLYTVRLAENIRKGKSGAI